MYRKPGMSIKLSKLVGLLSVVAILTAGVATSALAKGDGTHGFAPLNEAFEAHLRDQTMQRSLAGRPSGIVPSPLDLSHMRGRQVTPGREALAYSLPARYDLRELGRVTPAEDQYYCGSCWTFAACGSLESCLLPSEPCNFSENNFKNTHGFDPACCDGGHPLIAVAYLARWSGPVSQADDPYNPTSCASPANLTVRKHVQAVDFLPDRSGPLDNDNIKRAVMSHGAVYTHMYIDDAHYNWSTYAYYYDGAELNHAVCIVGWDDNFDSRKFVTTPPGNGAFICKNSFGPEWADDGFFYISYYDSKLVDNRVFRGVEPATNYDTIYQYDRFGWVGSFGLGTQTAWFANVFAATADSRVAAASWYVPTPGSPYDLYVYLDPVSSPTSGVLAGSKSGIISSAGYQTVTFDSPVPVSAGAKFAVVVRMTTPGYNYPIACEAAVPGYSSGATAIPGESYVSEDGVSWTDLTSYNATANVCLKAFTYESPRLTVAPENGLSSTGPQGGCFSPTSQDYTLTNIGCGSLTWAASKTQPWVELSAESGILASGDSATVTVSIGSFAKWMGVGSYSDTLTFTNAAGGLGNTSRPVYLTVAAPSQPPRVSISTAKRYASNAHVAIEQAIVTAVPGDGSFYAESSDRSSGVLVVNPSAEGTTAGTTVDIMGTVETTDSGEKCIMASEVIEIGTGGVAPLFLPNSSLGGGDWHYEPQTTAGQKGIKEYRWVKIGDEWHYLFVDAIGMSNIGLLVSTFGRVTFGGAGHFYVDDGSGAKDSSAFEGVKVLAANIAIPAENSYVRVTGISSCFRAGDDLYRMIRVHVQSDIEVIK